MYNYDVITYSTAAHCRGPATRAAELRSPASKRGQDKQGFCRIAAIYHNYGIIMA